MAAFVPVDERVREGCSLRHVRTSLAPQKAPLDYESLPPRGSDPAPDLTVSWAGSGVATSRKCEQCDNAQGNTQVFENSGLSYPNGNEWDDWELRCGKCGVFSYVCTFCEG